MNEFQIGQRWLSETETELGLGIIQNVDYRLVTIFFPACDEERAYAKNNAPLSRITFNPGDTITLYDNSEFEVTECEEIDGIVTYKAKNKVEPAEERLIPETQLGHQLQLGLASDRLFSKQIDKPKWFELRYATFDAQQRLQRSQSQGLLGPRVELIPHQLHIAQEVASRYAPRVLLSDEVGLGKTIEAGMIIHQQIRTYRAQRVLIVVPEALVHQWFVEMFRRFNLAFSIFDQERVESLEDEGNPFLSEQLILCSTQFITQCNLSDALAADWDLLVVDEAHHLEWHEQTPSHEYTCIEQLAHHTPGVLLLTATPEQLGIESHFARLRLLDPQRFSSLPSFIEEQGQYQETAGLAKTVLNEEQWPTEAKEQIKTQMPDIDVAENNQEEVLQRLTDCSGTSRIMFRNTRKNISGFPIRNVTLYPLDKPAIYSQEINELQTSLSPEVNFENDSWCQDDPRTEWLVNFLKDNLNEKVLVICARKETAMDLQAWISYKQGLRLAVFHEDMDIISRDRAAAYFAEDYDGAQALVCSEIGSEGRNFQFAQHLVLFDLPLNPDLLEQRIGRLDRIGQQDNIFIHVPHFADHPQAILAKWYHEGLNAFTSINPAAVHIAEEFKNDLLPLLQSAYDENKLSTLLERAQSMSQQLNIQLEEGRDCLLELSSNNPDHAEVLKKEIQKWDTTNPYELLEKIFDRFGVESEAHDENSWVYKPGDHMLTTAFPHLPEDGITATFDRSFALNRDDLHFLTWEHPLVNSAMDIVTSQNKGKACVCVLQNKNVKPGTLLIESLFVLQPQGPKKLQTQRFLPLTTIRVLSDVNGNNIADKVGHETLNQQCHTLEKHIAKKIIDGQQALLQKIINQATEHAEKQAENVTQESLQAMQKQQGFELKRLKALQAINPNIREEEIEFIEQQTDLLNEYIQQSRCQLDAIRVIIAS